MKEWLETGDDAILDILKAGDEEFIHRAFGPLIHGHEREHAAPLDLHLHVVFNQIGVTCEGHCFHVTEVQGLAELDQQAGTVFQRDEDFDVPVVTEGQIRGLVFISVAKRVQNPEGIEFARILRSTVRLQAIDECASGFLNPLQHLAPFTDVLTTIFEDRKLSSAAGASRILFANQSADETVQRRAKVVETITDDGAQVNRWKRISAVKDQPMIGAFVIDLAEDAWTCRFHKLGTVDLERAEMYLGKDFDAKDTDPLCPG